MNNELKQLAEQAGFVLWADESWNPGDVVDWSSSYDDELARFAQLVAQECAKICESLRPSKPEFDYRFWDGCTESAEAIKKHFGIR